MHETYRMLGKEHEADLEREASKWHRAEAARGATSVELTENREGSVDMRRRQRIRIAPVLAVVAALAVAATVVLAVVGAAVAGPTSGGANSTQAERVRMTERTRLRALVEADMTVARRLHAGDFQLINPAGGALSRDEYLGAVASGDIDYLVFEPASAIEVRLYGQAAVIRYRSNIDIVVSGLGRLTHQAWHTDLYERRQDRWQVVWSHATAIS